MQLLFALIILVFCTPASSQVDVSFPSLGDAIGAKLPEANLEKLNPRLNKDVLVRFSFDSTVEQMALNSIRGQLLGLREKLCGTSLGSEPEFMASVFIAKRFDDELLGLLRKSNFAKRARESLMYQSAPSEDNYKQLKEFPVNPLAKQFVAGWLATPYFNASERAMTQFSEQFLKSKCPR
jgi:hypothetical protein